MRYTFHACAVLCIGLLGHFLVKHAEHRREHIRATCDPQDGDNAVDVTLRRDGIVLTAQGLLVVPDAGRPFLADACRTFETEPARDEP